MGLSNATPTGWQQAGGERQVRWTPHTRYAFTAPPNETLLLLANGFMARRGYRQAIKQGRDQVLKYAMGPPHPDAIRSFQRVGGGTLCRAPP